MSDAPAYMLANLVINDVDEYRKYEKGFFPILKRFGGEFLTFDDQPHTFEGTTPPEGRLILFKFPKHFCVTFRYFVLTKVSGWACR